MQRKAPMARPRQGDGFRGVPFCSISINLCSLPGSSLALRRAYIVSACAQVSRQAFAWRRHLVPENRCGALEQFPHQRRPYHRLRSSRCRRRRAGTSIFGVLDRSIAHIVLRWAAAVSPGWIGLSMIRFVPLPTPLLRVGAASNGLVRITGALRSYSSAGFFVAGMRVGIFPVRNGSVRCCSTLCWPDPGSTARSRCSASD